MIDLDRGLIIDNFAGGGGASTGIEAALGRSPDVAINHDAEAVALHAANHPDTLHLCQNVWKADPREVVRQASARRCQQLGITYCELPVRFAWFSPDCKHFSKAKGSKPVEKGIRDLAWVVVHWARRVRPDIIALENVEEFKDWGPLVETTDGKLVPCLVSKGLTFKRWVRELKKLGYTVDHRELRACDYGAPTIRKRLFVVARRDGQPIRWAPPSHAKDGAGGLLPWRTAAECIEWDLDCPSIFERDRPLAENTLRRVARGVMRYVVHAEKPFIVGLGGPAYGGKPASVDRPLGSQTTENHRAVVQPFVAGLAHGDSGGRREYRVDEPLTTVHAGGGNHAIVEPFVARIGQTVRILIGDVRDKLRELKAESVDCVVTSPPYWGLRDYGVAGQLGLERSLGEHIETMVDVFREMRRVMKPEAPFWLNYGDCYATTPNGRSAADTKASGNDDRTFRDKPFSTVGPIYIPEERQRDRRGHNSTINGSAPHGTPGRISAGGHLKNKDLCLIPFRLVIALQEDGWWVRSRCLWGKPNGMPDSSGKYRPSVAHEEVFLLCKTGRPFYDADAVCAPVSGSTHARVSQNVAAQDGSTRANGGRKPNGNMKAVVRGRAPGVTPKSADKDSKVRANTSFHASTTAIVDTRYLRTYEPEVWHIPTAAYSDAHFATFPPALVERCLKAGLPKDRRCLVLDPFGGAGTTALVADRMGHDAIHIDLSPEYGAMALRRIKGDAPLFAETADA